MAYWDDQVDATPTTKRVVLWRCEVDGDIEGDPTLTMYLRKEQTQGGVTTILKDLGSETLKMSESLASLEYEPFATKIKNGFRGLARARRKA